MTVHNITFEGYKPDVQKNELPEYNGVYIVYRGKFIFNTPILREILYIGKADDQTIRERLANHEKHQLFVNNCRSGEQVIYSYAEVDGRSIDAVENALVFIQKPKLNTDLIDEYLHDDAEFRFTGKCALLKNTDFVLTLGE